MKNDKAKTLFEKVWDEHVVEHINDEIPDIFYIDLHLIHEVTSPQPFDSLRKKGRKIRRVDRTFATEDHAIPTKDTDKPIEDKLAARMVEALRKNTKEFGVSLYEMGTDNQGIVHMIGPELGITQPGLTIVCGDSHTSTHGAFGALGFGIGTSEVEMVMTTQCLLQKKPKTFEIRVDNTLQKGVTAKDIILTIINKNGVNGGIGHVFEYTGEAIRSLNMEERMTICNMSIEGGAKAGMIAPDDTTYEYMKGRDFAPKGKEWEAKLKYWKSLPTDKGATYDKQLILDAGKMAPMVTYGTNPGMSVRVTDNIPNKDDFETEEDKEMLEKSLEYMDLKSGQPMIGQKIDNVFFGSCTNSRITDMRAAAKIVKGKKVANGVDAVVVPGSIRVKKQAEKEGLDKIFKEAGYEWRGAGCSACLGMNNDKIPAGNYCASTSNRNFEGRQGKGARTFLMSPIMAAAASIEGRIVDVREYI
jgi:3-isopropylmalate/(R)-2-methylmalate dehydratase large subunit